jgi:hypothetical protein
VITWKAIREAYQRACEYLFPSCVGCLEKLSPKSPSSAIKRYRLRPAIRPTETRRAKCTGVMLREGMELSRFSTSPDGRTYRLVAGNWFGSVAPLRIFERLADGRYKLRTVLDYADDQDRELPPQ